jgi:chorismate mutase
MPTLTSTSPLDSVEGGCAVDSVEGGCAVDSVEGGCAVDSVEGGCAVDSVEGGRALIDDIDERLIALLTERRAVSQRIQRLRVDAGGSRVQHARENVVIRRWASALGDGGAELALAVLRHCRGG